MKNIITEKNDLKVKNISAFKIQYTNAELKMRLLERFDFADEWNNLGYGRITNDDSKWSISTFDTSHLNFAEILGYVYDKNNQELCPYCGIIEEENSVQLWFNRETGPNDGLDYHIVEDFLLNYKTDIYGSTPILSEIPYGYKSAVTMRIDCDEDIASGRPLFELYKEMNVPFSCAIKTQQDISAPHIKMMLDVIEAGGSIVSHSHTHAPNWGGSREKAKWEAETARDIIKKYLPEDYTYDYVVSPFHQNPQYAIQGLVDAGIKGFVSGIIKNDPEYLQARAGYVSTGEDIITHSQQCMLHGDCYHDAGNSIDIYKESFLNHYNTNTFFGFLDHPFSNYWYGWSSEKERVAVHREFLEFIKSHEHIWYANLIDSLNFLWVKSNTKIWVENDQLQWSTPEHNFKIPNMKVLWKDKEIEIKS